MLVCVLGEWGSSTDFCLREGFPSASMVVPVGIENARIGGSLARGSLLLVPSALETLGLGNA